MTEEDAAKAFCERVAEQLRRDGATLHQIAHLFRMLRTSPPKRTVYTMCLTDELYRNCGMAKQPRDELPYCILARVLAIHMHIAANDDSDEEDD